MSNLTFKPLKKGGKTLFLFDIDGTLTIPRQSIKEDMVNCLKSLQSKNITIASIGGSDANKAKEQLKESISLFKYVFTENGLVSFDQQGKIFHSKKLSEFLGDEKIKELANFCLRYIADLDIPVKRGTFFEFRTGMINVSPIGRNCSLDERKAFAEYNKEHKVIETFKAEVEKNFGEKFGLKLAIGGQISFDVYPKGWGKDYCLQFVKEYENIIFFGDKTQEGGNDHDIAISDEITRAYKVLGPEDSIVKINEVVKEIENL